MSGSDFHHPPSGRSRRLWPHSFIPVRHSLGRVIVNAAIAAAVPEAVIIGMLDGHAARDWGDLDAEDKAANDADHSHLIEL
jgi:hypothetical protein